MNKKVIIGLVLLVVALVLIVFLGGEREPRADQIPKATTQPEDSGIKGLNIN